MTGAVKRLAAATNSSVSEPQYHAAEIDTVKRLRSLAPGQTITYYRGDFESDIARCVPHVNDRGAPHYAALLQKIHDCARTLEASGAVHLSERNVEIETRGARKFSIVEYRATGWLANLPPAE